MTITKLINQITGTWIAQTTNYSMIKNKANTLNNLTNQIKWVNLSLEDNDSFLIRKKYLLGKKTNFIAIYKKDFITSNYDNQIYYFLFLEDKLGRKYLVKLDKTLKMINRFIVRKYSSNYIYLSSNQDSLTLNEKIYFLNNKVKIVKSMIKKYNQCIATSFSSEIKIN